MDAFEYLWSIIKCTFYLNGAPGKFVEIGEWVWSFPSKVRAVVAAGAAALVRTTWKIRNAAVFDNIFPKYPCGMVSFEHIFENLNIF